MKGKETNDQTIQVPRSELELLLTEVRALKRMYSGETSQAPAQSAEGAA